MGIATSQRKGNGKVTALARHSNRPGMLEVHELASKGEPSGRLALTWELRRKSRLKTTTVRGQTVGLFLPRGTVLFDGDLVKARKLPPHDRR